MASGNFGKHSKRELVCILVYFVPWLVFNGTNGEVSNSTTPASTIPPLSDSLVLTISISPSNWINYTDTAFVTFTFSPPCPNISLYKSAEVGNYNACVVGPACPSATVFSFSGRQLDPAGGWIRVQNVNDATNGYYYGVCPSQPVPRQYRTNNGTGWNLNIGINPRILRLSTRQGYFSSAYNFTRYSRPDQLDLLAASGSLQLTIYDSITLEFEVGQGALPSGSETGFQFLIPEFDQPTGNFSFVRKISSSARFWSSNAMRNKMTVTYQVMRSDLIKRKICSLEATAIATLAGAPYQDAVVIQAPFTYAMSISSISLDRSGNGTDQCSCLFTCQVYACPLMPILRTEWGFINPLPSATVYIAGNVPDRLDKFQLDPTDCQAKFRLAMQSPTTYQITCRVFTQAPNGPFRQLPASTYTVALWSLFRPCSAAEFQCATSKECIAANLKCDSRPDCQDGSDELGCIIDGCPISSFKCGTSRMCIDRNRVCNGANDCLDASDERNCSRQSTPCALGYFRCANGQCARGSYTCDGDNDCGDASDELQCGGFLRSSRCRPGQFVCNDSGCISNQLVCNQANDCTDGSDESNCGSYFSAICGSSFWRCANSVCVSSSALCNGIDNCGDNSDEAFCQIGSPASGLSPSVPANSSVIGASCNSLTQFQCSNGRCVPIAEKCDGRNACGDNSDENPSMCATCPSGRFHCTNNRCINARYMCDGNNDCTDNSDEAASLCNTCSPSANLWRCEVSQKCISNLRLCDAMRDCGVGDDSDETPDACAQAQSIAARTTFCQPGTVKCASSNVCVPQSAICNDISDCCQRTMSYSIFSFAQASENETHIGNCEKTDEIGCDRNSSCSVENGGCQTGCISIILPSEPNVCGTNSGPSQAAYCTCDKGYARPMNNTKLCVDIDECSLTPFANNCSQICTNSPGSYACSCQSGFVDKGIAAGRNASGLCVVDPQTGLSNDAMVFMINGDTIRMWNKTSRISSVIETGRIDQQFTALVVDFRDQTVIFAQAGVATLRRTSVPINGQQPQSLALHNPMTYNLIVDMAVDFIGGNLYVTDIDATQQSRIVVSLLDGRYQKALLSNSIQITSIAVNPLLGRLYYAVYSPYTAFSLQSRASIIMTSMNGSTYSNVKIYSPFAVQAMVKSIAVDYLASGRIYFHDGQRVILANSDGAGNASFTLSLYSAANRPFDVFGNFIFGLFMSDSYALPEQRTHKLCEVDKFSRAVVTNVTGSMVGASFVRVHHDLKAGNRTSWPNPCAPLKCSHLCLLNMEKGASCACPDGQDQATCTSTRVDPPPHPADCYRNCIQGQGVCVKDPNRDAVVCLCNSQFSGPNCNETILPIPIIHVNNNQSSIVEYVTASQSNSRPEPVFVALLVIACIILVLILVLFAVGGYCLYRKRRSGTSAFNMQQLSNEPTY